MTNVRSILSAASARRRDLTAVQQLQAKRDERQARAALYGRDFLDRTVSRSTRLADRLYVAPALVDDEGSVA